MTDLTYTTDKMFTRFYAETPAGESVCRQIHDQNGGRKMNQFLVTFGLYSQMVIYADNAVEARANFKAENPGLKFKVRAI